MSFSGKSVRDTPEVSRILNLPRRKADGTELVQSLTEVLKTPQGTWTLKPLQAQALYDMGTMGGLFGPLRVGLGKTLLTLMAPLILGAKRPVLLIPASLIDKTKDERIELSKHWKIPSSTRLISYTKLGIVSGVDELNFYRPDLIIADECHKLKNKRAGVTKRVVRYMRDNPGTKFVAVSGTVMKDSIRDFAHILRWCLKENTPLPKTEEELEEWADALDQKTNPLQRLDPGPLVAMSYGDPDLGAVRRGFQARLLETPGIVGSTGDQVACSLLVEGHTYPVGPETGANFTKLRTLWETPDGYSHSEAVEHWRHARELALGLHYRWEPPAPQPWLEARKAWAAKVREVLSRSRTLDTELQVTLAVDRGQCEGAELLQAWRDIKDTYIYKTVAVWHDPEPMRWVVKWMEKGAGIVWTEHTLFAEQLAKVTGRPYFGANGVDSQGNVIEKASGSIIASIAANSTGRNLQKWSRNLITSVPGNAPMWEQLLGRTHRDGQQADTVTVDLMIGCAEHINGFLKATEAARAQRDMLGHTQKLLLADVVLPPASKMLDGATPGRWAAAFNRLD